ncbi:AAA-like domain-containing protein [Leptolyngbya iicbica]|uniref:LuxR family transcriptional regulator n=2 Tax=Cyanophyceae TaxID=3028117 RepID=A0A4V2E2S3_9CYAN|nr:AAA-like domain-containing protein [Leptolyngbya sp. LK]RZM79556.1 LuxR family transcriptional regulator [Leptolyngbya sp. LK]
MNRQEFETSFESLTPRQKDVLWPFLAFQTDEEIATELHCTPANVRHHIANVCKRFGYTNDEGESYSYRHDLVEAFIQHQPKKVSTQWQAKLLAAQPEEPEFPGRPLLVDSRYYLERPPAEQRALKVLKPGALVRVRGPRKTGKTSLLYRTLHQAREYGCQTAAVKLYRAGSGILGDVRRFLQWFCLQISDEVGLPPKLEDYWSDLRGDASSCSQYLQSYLLDQLEQPIVIGIDEADLLFEYPATAETFFRLVRGWSEEAKSSERWQQFRQVVVYATEVYIDFDLNQSPFNVGTPIKLAAFGADQVQELAWRYGLKTFTIDQANDLMGLVGGQPHLIQLALYHLYDGWTFEQVMITATSQTGIYSNHLQALMDKLTAHDDLAEAFKTVVAAPSKPVTLAAKPAKQLEGLGLVKRNDTEVELSCQLYRQYFGTHL